MKKLIELAKGIKDKKLRELTIKFLENPEISNTTMLYPKEELEKIPCWAVGAHHRYEGGLVEHTLGVTKIALELANTFEEVYKLKVNKDHLIAGCLLHDIMKVFMIRKSGKAWDFTGTILDHADFTACELYARNFPEEVIHMVAAHGGDMGAASANPKTSEAMLLYYADMIDASMETSIHGSPSLEDLQLLFMPQGEGEEK